VSSVIELIIIAAVVIFFSRLASAHNKSEIIWGAVAFGLCMGCLFFVPLPFLRVLIAAGATLIIWMAYLLIADKV